MTRFSILIPTYNRCALVQQAIESLLGQSFKDFEVFVVDDGSTDETPRVLEQFGSQITALRQSNLGPEVARNKAAALSRGEYLLMLDHDDLLPEYSLATYDRVIRAFQSPPLVIGSMMRFRGAQAPPIKPPASKAVEVLQYPDFLSRDIPLHISNSRILVRRDVFFAVGGYGSPYITNFYSDDFNFLLKIGTDGPCIIVQEPCTLMKRDHGSNISLNLTATANGMLGLVRSERAGLYPGGGKRRFERYACVGGLLSAYAARYCWRGGQRRLALRMFYEGAPMVSAAICKKFSRPFRRPPQRIVVDA